MPEVTGAHVWQTGPFEQRLEVPAIEVGLGYRGAGGADLRVDVGGIAGFTIGRTGRTGPTRPRYGERPRRRPTGGPGRRRSRPS